MKARSKIRQDTLNSLIIDTIDNSLDSYMLIDKRVLQLDCKLDFNLYSFNDESHMSVFLENNTVIDKAYKSSILNMQEIYAKKTDRSKYDSFLEKNIQNIVYDNTLTLEEKTDIIYESTSNLTQSLYSNPNALKNAKRSENIVAPVLANILYNNATVSSYIKIIEYDYYTHTHSLNVSIYALCLGAFLNMDKNRLKLLGKSALLHDLGKSSINSKIVNKPGRLTPEEFETMKSHPSFGYVTALKIGLEDKDILDGIRHHHEKLNGLGYPDGLKGDEITEFARIIGVCDIFDALTTRRSYKEGMKSFDALILMKKEMNEHLDMSIVNSFIKMLHD